MTIKQFKTPPYIWSYLQFILVTGHFPPSSIAVEHWIRAEFDFIYLFIFTSDWFLRLL